VTEPSLLRLANETGGRALSLPAGAVVFRPGSECPGFVVVKSGSIRVTLVSEEGREVVLYRVRPGEICLQTFACLSRGATYAAEGVVETPVDGVLIPPAQFQKLVSESGAFRSAVFEAIAARFSEFEHVVETLAFTGIESRVASALLLLAGDGHLVTATHHDIATEIGSAREVVSRQLKLLAQSGAIAMSRGHIDILDKAKLLQVSSRPV
jgi:CRP/FNR family transcriptional regulator